MPATVFGEATLPGTAPSRLGGQLHAGLDFRLPDEVVVGDGTALFVCGWCFHSEARITGLQLVVGSEGQPVTAFGMPRLDLYRELHPELDPYETVGMDRDPASAQDPALRSYRSGFWGTFRIPPQLAADGGEERSLVVRAELDGGGAAEVTLGAIALRSGSNEFAAPLPPTDGDGPLVVICMATYNPPAELLVRQIESIRAQSHANWLCIVSDDSSTAQSFAVLEQIIRDDERFFVSRSRRRLGFYRNFERALSMVPPQAEYVALADQDDNWDADKLATLLKEIGDARLAYSDARIVTRDGELVSNTYWSERRNNHRSMLSLLMTNSVTGAASLVRKEVLDYALPFPPAQFAHFHDHWIAVCALALGEIAFVDRPLYDYVQHHSASLGHTAANRMPTLGDRISGIRTRPPRERVRKWRMHYFVDIARLEQFATILEMRCGTQMTRAKRRELDRILKGEGSLLTMATLARRGIRELFGRSETLGAEVMLFLALLWRVLLGLTVRDRPQRRLRLDAVPPPELAAGPDRSGAPVGSSARSIEDKIAPLPFDLREDAPGRVNVLIPTVDLEHLFAGYIGKFNLALRLAERGARVRIVTTDPTPRLPGDWARRLSGYEGLSAVRDRLEFAFGRESSAIEVSPGDAFVATTWWTAHIAARALTQLGGERFLYLIQEYEPFTFPMGTLAALARESYELPHFALFSSELLRGWFRDQRIGVYAWGASAGDAASASFENAITTVPTPSPEMLSGRRPRRLLFYARPEPHAARNMFELGVLALSRAVNDGAFLHGWELHGVGTVALGRKLALAGGVELELLPRMQQADYARLLSEHDVGLALMYTPHPSLVPIEMAAAGMLTVTNTFANKTAEALQRISENLIAAPPTIDGVAEALVQATHGVEDVERRLRGSEVGWSRDWAKSLPDELMARLEGFLDPDRD